ncbi:MAG: hypothetical protein ACE5GL_00355 [Calditrichia bacterium]
MKHNNQFYESQLEAIKNYYEKLSREKNQPISLKQAVLEWFINGHAEKFRKEFLNKHAAMA